MADDYYAIATKEGTQEKARDVAKKVEQLRADLANLAAVGYTKELPKALDELRNHVNRVTDAIAEAQARQDIRDAEALIAKRRKQLGEDDATQD